MCKLVSLLHVQVLINENQQEYYEYNHFHINYTGLGLGSFYIKNRFYVVSKCTELCIYKTELNRSRNVLSIWSYMKKYKFLRLHLVFLKICYKFSRLNYNLNGHKMSQLFFTMYSGWSKKTLKAVNQDFLGSNHRLPGNLFTHFMFKVC